MMIAADTPPAAVQAVPAEEVVLGRHDSTALAATQDFPLILTKGRRREDAVVRLAVFTTSSVTVTRPRDPAAGGEAPYRYRWTHQAYLQRQVCFTSIAGLFSCAVPEVEPLPDRAAGEAETKDMPDSFPLADADRGRLAEQLRLRSAGLFEADRRAKVDPIFKAAGVVVAAPAPPHAAAKSHPSGASPAAHSD
jgi:hypothetical protein